MGQLIMTIAGTVVGGLVGGPFGAQVGALIGGQLGATLFGPTISGPRMSDLTVSASTYGVAIPELYGTMRVPGNMIWTAGIKEKKKKSGGKGGPKQTTYSYSASFAMGFCKGEIEDFIRIWADGKLIYGGTVPRGTNNGESIIVSIALSGNKKKKKYKFRFYKGTESQLPDSVIANAIGIDDTPAYRGLAYIVFEDMPLEDFGNRIPNMSAEITKNAVNGSAVIRATDIGGSNSSEDGSWVPDWENNRIIRVTGSGTCLYDLSTMQQQTTFRGFARSNAVANIPAGGRFTKQITASNTRPREVYDGTTFDLITTIGDRSNNTNINIVSFCSGFQDGYSFSNRMGNCFILTGSGKKQYVIDITWKSKALIFEDAVDLAWYGNAPFIPSVFVQCREGSDFSQTVGWRRSGGGLQIQIWTISAGASGGRNTEPGTYPVCGGFGQGATFTQAGGVSVETVFIQPNLESYTPDVVLYDPTDDCLFSIGDGPLGTRAFKWHMTERYFKWIRDYPYSEIEPPKGAMARSRLNGDWFGWARNIGNPGYGSSGRTYAISLQNGDVVRRASFSRTAYGNLDYWPYNNMHWDDVSRSLIFDSNSAFWRLFYSAGSSKVTLQSTVEDILSKTGVLSTEDYDASGLAGKQLIGYLIDREATARDCLKQLGSAFLFDGYESDYQLKFKLRGGDPIVDIPESWLGNLENNDVQVRETMAQELELPMRVTVKYYDQERDYQMGSQFAKRMVNPVPTMLSSKEESLDLPLVYSADEAKQTADKILRLAWNGRTQYETKLPWRYLKYDPTDIGTITLDNGTVFTFRFNKLDIGADYSIAAGGTSENATSYVSTATADPGLGVPAQYTGDPVPAFPIAINTPLLRDVDYTNTGIATCYFSAAAKFGPFAGAYLARNITGAEYTTMGFISAGTESGYTLTVLPKTNDWGSTDETTTLIVRLNDLEETLESVTQDEMLIDYANTALVGDEVIQFREATLNSDNTWSLRGILRARRGTNYAVGTHVKGERFVMLNEANVIRLDRPPEMYYETASYKAVPSGSVTEEAQAYTFNITPRDLQPYTVENVKCVDDNTDVTITFERRSRVTAPLIDYKPLIHYKENNMLTAKVSYRIWYNADLSDFDVVLASEPNKTGTVKLFDADGDDIPPVIEFPLADLTGQTKMLVELVEEGFVSGIPKYVEFNRIDDGIWDPEELY